MKWVQSWKKMLRLQQDVSKKFILRQDYLLRLKFTWDVVSQSYLCDLLSNCYISDFWNSNMATTWKFWSILTEKFDSKVQSGQNANIGTEPYQLKGWGPD